MISKKELLEFLLKEIPHISTEALRLTYEGLIKLEANEDLLKLINPIKKELTRRIEL